MRRRHGFRLVSGSDSASTAAVAAVSARCGVGYCAMDPLDHETEAVGRHGWSAARHLSMLRCFAGGAAGSEGVRVVCFRAGAHCGAAAADSCVRPACGAAFEDGPVRSASWYGFLVRWVATRSGGALGVVEAGLFSRFHCGPFHWQSEPSFHRPRRGPLSG